MNMFNFQNKKGVSQTWWIIATAIIVLLVVILMVLWFRTSGGKAFETVGEKLEGLDDCDKDQVADIFDKCPCDASILDEFPEGVTECKTKCTGNKEADCKLK